MIKFKAKYLKLLYPFMAKNEIRYYLEGVYVEPHPDGGVTLVATDGKAMICIRDIKGHCDNSRIIKITPDAVRKSGATHLTRCETFCTVDEDTQRLTIGAFYPEICPAISWLKSITFSLTSASSKESSQIGEECYQILMG